MKRTFLTVMLVLVLTDLTGFQNLSGLAHAQTGGGPSASLEAGYDLTWSSVDGGGVMNATGGAYTLGGTIGQPDAGAMSVSGYTLAGGFWHDWGAQFDVFLPLVVR